MNISTHDKKLLILFLALAVFLVAYLLVINPYITQKNETQAEIDSLYATLSEYRGYYDNLSTYQEETEQIKKNVSASLATYPSDVRSEDILMYATELADNIGISVSSISVDSPVVSSQFNIPKQTDQSYEMVPYSIVKVGFSIGCGLNYTQLKKLIDYVYNSSNQTALDKVSVSYSSDTGNLIGTVEIDKYFVTTSDYIYAPTDIPSVVTGIEDPFGTFSTESADKTAQTQEGDQTN